MKSQKPSLIEVINMGLTPKQKSQIEKKSEKFKQQMKLKNKYNRFTSL
jgi:hypothetical protein